jgi:L-ribulose-5-phosphate 3-epimerase
MNLKLYTNRLAVCSWSLQPKSPDDLADQLDAIGIHRVQLALDPIRENPATWGACFEVLKKRGVETASGMMTCVGEDYSTLESIRITGGLTPDHTWEQNLKNFTENADLMRKNGLAMTMFHAGFLPHEERDPNFAKMLQRLETVADVFAGRGLNLILETGQESGPALLAFLKHLNRPNVAANFDPANMILYNNGNPIDTLRILGQYVRNVHIKDANVTKVPGTWGEEVVTGTGQVEWPRFFAALNEIGFSGDLCIEREAGNQRVADIRAARVYLNKLLA